MAKIEVLGAAKTIIFKKNLPGVHNSVAYLSIVTYRDDTKKTSNSIDITVWLLYLSNYIENINVLI